MKLQIELDKVSKSGDMREKIIKKFSGLEKYLQKIGEDLRHGFVRVAKGDRFGYKVSFGLRLPHKLLFTEEKRARLLDAVDEVKDEMATQVRKYADKLKRGKKK